MKLILYNRGVANIVSSQNTHKRTIYQISTAWWYCLRLLLHGMCKEGNLSLVCLGTKAGTATIAAQQQKHHNVFIAQWHVKSLRSSPVHVYFNDIVWGFGYLIWCLCYRSYFVKPRKRYLVGCGPFYLFISKFLRKNNRIFHCLKLTGSTYCSSLEEVVEKTTWGTDWSLYSEKPRKVRSLSKPPVKLWLILLVFCESIGQQHWSLISNFFSSSTPFSVSILKFWVKKKGYLNCKLEFSVELYIHPSSLPYNVPNSRIM